MSSQPQQKTLPVGMEISPEHRQEGRWERRQDGAQPGPVDGPKQMPGFLEPLLSGIGQRLVSATQGLGLEPVLKAAECVHSTRELASFGERRFLVHHFLPESFGFFLNGHKGFQKPREVGEQVGEVQLLSRAFSVRELALLFLWILLGKTRRSDSGEVVESVQTHSGLLPWVWIA